jgi:hypothetical protein
MRSQSPHVLLPSLAMSLHTPPEREHPRGTDVLPPRTPDERSRELCTHSRLLLWRAQRACAASQQLRERIRRDPG